MNVYLLITGTTAANIFTGGHTAVIGDTQVNSAILDAWSDAELARLGLVRAPSVTPAFDPSTTILTGSWAAEQAAGAWQWVAQSRALTAAEIAAALIEAKAAQTAVINAGCQRDLAALVAAYPDLEIATWPQQYAEAQAYTASAAAPTPMLSAIAAASGQTVATLAAAVMAKAASYQIGSGALIGKRQTLSAQIAGAATVAAVQAVVW